MQLYITLFVFIFIVFDFVESDDEKPCMKNILGTCIKPLVSTGSNWTQAFSATGRRNSTKSLSITTEANFTQPASLKGGVTTQTIPYINRTELCKKYGHCRNMQEKISLRDGEDNEEGEKAGQTEPPVNEFRNLTWDVFCKFQPNGFNCGEKGYAHIFYFDLKLLGCKTAEVGEKCPHNYNQFTTINDCYNMCRDEGEHTVLNQVMTPHAFCRLQPDFGDCDGYYPSFYFDVTERTCRGFSYSGCGGNINRFPTAQLCAAECGPFVDYRPMFIQDS